MISKFITMDLEHILMIRLIRLTMIAIMVMSLGIAMTPMQTVTAGEEKAEVFINRDLEVSKESQLGSDAVFAFNSSITIINYRPENIELRFPTTCTFEIGINASFVDSGLSSERRHGDVCAPAQTTVILKPGQNNFSVSGSILISKWDDKILPDGKYVLFVTQASYMTPTESDYSVLDPEIFDNYGVILLVNNGKYSYEFDVYLGCSCAYNSGGNAADQRLSYPSLSLGVLGLTIIVLTKVLIPNSKERKN